MTTIGTGGADVKAINTGTVTIDPAAHTATVGDIVEATGAITGVASGDVVVLVAPATLAADVVFNVVSCETDLIRVRWIQGTASQDVASTAYRYLWFDLT